MQGNAENPLNTSNSLNSSTLNNCLYNPYNIVSPMMRAQIKLAGLEGLDVLEKSIAPEAATDMPRTKISVEREDDGLVVNIEAEDASSLRAALNSYLRWINLAMETKDMTSDSD